jgi:hypothetical protein
MRTSMISWAIAVATNWTGCAFWIKKTSFNESPTIQLPIIATLFTSPETCNALRFEVGPKLWHWNQCFESGCESSGQLNEGRTLCQFKSGEVDNECQANEFVELVHELVGHFLGGEVRSPESSSLRLQRHDINLDELADEHRYNHNRYRCLEEQREVVFFAEPIEKTSI